MRSLILTFIFLGLFASCSKDDCNCSNEDIYVLGELYFTDDVVLYNDECYIAVARGRNIVPGPWQQDGNDIWMICE